MGKVRVVVLTYVVKEENGPDDKQFINLAKEQAEHWLRKSTLDLVSEAAAPYLYLSNPEVVVVDVFIPKESE